MQKLIERCSDSVEDQGAEEASWGVRQERIVTSVLEDPCDRAAPLSAHQCKGVVRIRIMVRVRSTHDTRTSSVHVRGSSMSAGSVLRYAE